MSVNVWLAAWAIHPWRLNGCRSPAAKQTKTSQEEGSITDLYAARIRRSQCTSALCWACNRQSPILSGLIFAKPQLFTKHVQMQQVLYPWHEQIPAKSMPMMIGNRRCGFYSTISSPKDRYRAGEERSISPQSSSQAEHATGPLQFDTCRQDLNLIMSLRPSLLL
jgi:hypothetical protein